MALAESLDEARLAFAAHDWQSAYRLFTAADADAGIPGLDLAHLAESARWSRRFGEVVGYLERAEIAFHAEGDKLGAARMAFLQAREHAERGESSIAMGCYYRARRLIENEPESSEHGLLAWYSAMTHFLVSSDLDAARAELKTVREIAARLHDSNLEALGLVYEGHLMITTGQVAEGLGEIDQGAAVAMGGDVELFTTGEVYCSTIFACRNVGDWQRAAAWTDAATRWSQREHVTGFPGLCKFHRAEVMRLRGALDEAEQDAKEAVEELVAATPRYAGWAFHELGEVRRRRGDRDGTRDAFRRALEYGFDPQPGLALLTLDEGDAPGALRAIERALQNPTPFVRESRPLLLPPAVTVALAAGDLAHAHRSLAELEALAEAYATSSVVASVDVSRGEIALAEGRIADAAELLRRGVGGWTGVHAPYETAKAQILCATAVERLGDDATARMEREAALTTFERLGAVDDIAHVRALLAPAKLAPASRTTRAFMFTDIVGSTPLVEAMGDEAWQHLLDWHDRTLRECIQEHGGEEAGKEGDGFFVVFPDAVSAIDCGIEIQRKLAQHRRDHGFAPRVRIGIHVTEATKTESGYLGLGVHAAARVGAAAVGDEVLVSMSSLGDPSETDGPSQDGLGSRYTLGEQRSLTLKGIGEPVRVVSIEWA